MTLTHILIVDNDAQRASELAGMLRTSGYTTEVESEEEFHLHLKKLKPGILLMVLESPGRQILWRLESILRNDPRPIIIFSSDDGSDTIQAATQAGVSAYVVDGYSIERVRPIIETAVARFQVIQALQTELKSTKADLVSRKFLDRAKGLVMDQRNCTEAEAYRILQKMAMDRKKRIADVAQDVLSVGEILAAR